MIRMGRGYGRGGFGLLRPRQRVSFKIISIFLVFRLMREIGLLGLRHEGGFVTKLLVLKIHKLKPLLGD